jgi:hypothetical protein
MGLPPFALAFAADRDNGGSAMKIEGASRILSICDDRPLASSRELLLESAGHEVESVFSDTGSTEWPAKPFHIAILCHTIDDARRHRLIATLRQLHPEIRVVAVRQFAARPDPELDGECCLDEGPQGLLNLIEACCSDTAPKP